MTRIRDAELWRRVLDARLLTVHTSMPGIVKAFDASAQTVEVQPAIQHVHAGETTETVESYPVLYDVPVIYPRAAGTLVAFPLAAGDLVTLVFNEWPIDNFREKGREVHPIDLDRHALGSAVAYPGGPYPDSQALGETINSVMIGYDGGALTKMTSGGLVELGTSAGTKQFVALATDTQNEISALRSAVNDFVTTFNTHVHPTAAAGPPSTPTPPLAVAPPAVGSVGSTKVKAQE